MRGLWPVLAGADTPAVEIPEVPKIDLRWPEIYANLLANGLRIILIILLTLAALWLFRRILTRLGWGRAASALTKMDDRQRRLSTILAMANTVGSILIWGVAGAMILGQLGVGVAPLLTGAGVIGIAIGFGAQSTIRNILAGITLLLNDRIRVGDIVTVNTMFGTVEEITLHATVLRGFNGDAYIIPNGLVETVTNHTYRFSNVLMDIGVDYSSEPDRVIGVLTRVTEELQQDSQWAEYFLEPPRILGIQGFSESAVLYRVVLRVRASWQWSIARELRRRLWYAF
ncbi:MAG TPA: mechanosensitive ion channel family protein, partial [bacterium]|nr:mechanosensitive ion channel family protein [bacterium]